MNKSESGRLGWLAVNKKYGSAVFRAWGLRGGRPRLLDINRLHYEKLIILQMYCKELRTIREVAEELHVSPKTIGNRMKMFGIKKNKIKREILVSEPYSGELRRGYQFGNIKDKGLYKWCACIDCNKYRWVQVYRHNNLIPTYERCPSCANKANGKKHCGANNPSWKGGMYLNSSGYAMVFNPEHPRARKDGHIKRAILVLEKHLGRFVPREMDVHHINGIKDDDRPENLIEMPHKEHAEYHLKEYIRQQQSLAQTNNEGGLGILGSNLTELKRLWKHRNRSNGHNKNKARACLNQPQASPSMEVKEGQENHRTINEPCQV